MFIQHLLSSTLYSSDNEITVTPITRTFFFLICLLEVKAQQRICAW